MPGLNWLGFLVGTASAEIAFVTAGSSLAQPAMISAPNITPTNVVVMRRLIEIFIVLFLQIVRRERESSAATPRNFLDSRLRGNDGGDCIYLPLPPISPV